MHNWLNTDRGQASLLDPLALPQKALALAEAVTEGRVTDEVHAQAMRHFDHHDYVELAAVAAFYAMVGRMLDAMAVPLDEDVRNYQPKLK